MSKVSYKCVYKTDNHNDLFVYVEDIDLLKKWKSDSTIPLAQVVQAFEIFDTDTGSHNGIASTASKQTVSNALGTENIDEAIKKILHEGELIKASAFNERVNLYNSQ